MVRVGVQYVPLTPLGGLENPGLSALSVLCEPLGSVVSLFVLYLLLPAPSLGRGRGQAEVRNETKKNGVWEDAPAPFFSEHCCTVRTVRAVYLSSNSSM